MKHFLASFPVSLRLAACYCLIPLLLSVLAIPSIAWGQSTSVDTQVELAFWNTVKDSNNPAMLHAYLAQYPDGEFASLATILLESLAEQNSSAEISFWQSVQDSDDPDLIQTYLTNYPDGNFVVLANIKLAELTETAQAEAQPATPETSQSAETESEPATQETSAEVAARGDCPVGMIQTYRGCEDSTVDRDEINQHAREDSTVDRDEINQHAQAAAENLATARAIADAAGAEAQAEADTETVAETQTVADTETVAEVQAAAETQAECQEIDARIYEWEVRSQGALDCLKVLRRHMHYHVHTGHPQVDHCGQTANDREYHTHFQQEVDVQSQEGHAWSNIKGLRILKSQLNCD